MKTPSNEYHPDYIYQNLLREILDNGIKKEDRTGTGTISRFGTQMRFDLRQGLPLLTTKKVPFKIILGELLWFIKGDTKLKTLLDQKIHIWDEWPFKHYLIANKLPIPTVNSVEWTNQMKEFTDRILSDEQFEKQWGDLGPVYGKQWRDWKNLDGSSIDQLKNAIQLIRKCSGSKLKTKNRISRNGRSNF